MTDKQKPDTPETTSGGLSSFDKTIIAILLVLGGAVLLLTITGDPIQQGDRVAFLYPARDGLQNIWLAPVDDPTAAEKITNKEAGVYDFDVSDDGRYIAYAARDPETRLNDIWLLDMVTGNERRLTDCAAQYIDCRTPVFKPDATIVAYERQRQNRDIEALGTGAIRIWLLDTTTAETTALSPDPQLVGYGPVWSGDGNSIAFYSADITQPGVLVYNFGAETSDKPQLHFIPSQYGTTGDLSPSGDELIFPDVVQRSRTFTAYLRIVELSGDDARIDEFTSRQQPHDDSFVEWHPSGEYVTILRRYMDERITPGHQIYDVDVETGEASPLVVDERYNHSALQWNPSGDALLMQRFPMLNADGSPSTNGQPQIWVLDTSTDTLIEIAENAFLPRWIPGS
jgi:Tol biopolymer transport system component